jgi:hypothetical protein
MRQFKAPIAGNSPSIAKIGNAELAHFNQQMLIHELIRGSIGDSATYSKASSCSRNCAELSSPLC